MKAGSVVWLINNRRGESGASVETHGIKSCPCIGCLEEESRLVPRFWGDGAKGEVDEYL